MVRNISFYLCYMPFLEGLTQSINCDLCNGLIFVGPRRWRSGKMYKNLVIKSEVWIPILLLAKENQRPSYIRAASEDILSKKRVFIIIIIRAEGAASEIEILPKNVSRNAIRQHEICKTDFDLHPKARQRKQMIYDVEIRSRLRFRDLKSNAQWLKPSPRKPEARGFKYCGWRHKIIQIDS